MRKLKSFNHGSYEDAGLTTSANVYLDMTVPALHEQIIQRGEALISESGSIVVDTGQFTGRSPGDKFIVYEPGVADRIAWTSLNQPFESERFEAIYRRVRDYLATKDIFVQDRFAGADTEFRLPIRVITETAWQSLFARHLFIDGKAHVDPRRAANRRANPSRELYDGAWIRDFRSGMGTSFVGIMGGEGHRGQTRVQDRLTVISTPYFRAEPRVDGTKSETFILLDLARRLILIGGTGYAGEIKKAVFTAMNYFLPVDHKVLPMHCSANVGASGDVALFFGLSGTGKTTLSTDPERRLIGDDEHGWSDAGIFNIEGGCYAKVIRLSAEDEPQIYAAIHRFGTVLENVAIDSTTRILDLDDATHTENTRAAYPLSYIPDTVPTGRAGHPHNVFLLTADAFGVLPPVAKLTTAQAVDFFMLGYTAKVAGTEKGLSGEPEATFSPCFGAPFMPLDRRVYAELLAERLERHQTNCWLINTGWISGQAGVGSRIPIAITRAIIRAALDGRLSEAPLVIDPVFGLPIPTVCPDVPSEMLQPRALWRDPDAYDQQARKLAARFEQKHREMGSRAL